MISEKQKAILAFPYTDYDALICDGAIRSGKTSIMFLAYVDWAMREFDGKRFIVLGKTVGSALRNVVEPYMMLGYALEKYDIKFNRAGNRMTVTDGIRTNYFDVFGGKDESSYMLIQGFTAAGCFVDEVALCTRSAVEQALARCSVDGSKFWFNCNPDAPTHWFNVEWIMKSEERNALHLHFELRDNPSLTPRIIERYESQYTGLFKQRYIDGLWVVAEGLVYQFEREEVTGDPERDCGALWYISCDYGITNPFAAILWRVEADRAYAVKEYYFDSRKECRRKTDAQHYEALEKLAGNHEIEAIVIDPSATSFKEEIVAHDRFDYINANNDVIPGIAVTSSMLDQGYVKISPTCDNTLCEIGLYRWDEKATKDAVIKENDHAMDAMRYMCNSVLKYELEGFAWD